MQKQNGQHTRLSTNENEVEQKTADMYRKNTIMRSVATTDMFPLSVWDTQTGIRRLVYIVFMINGTKMYLEN